MSQTTPADTALPGASKLTPSGLPGRRGRIAVEKPANSGRVVRRLWAYLRHHSGKLALVFGLVVLNTASTVGGSYLLRPIINLYILPHNWPGLLRMLFVLLCIYIAGAIAAALQSRLMVVVAQRTVSDIRADLFSRLQTLPLRFYDTHGHGDLMSRFTNDMDNVSDSLNNSVTQIFSSGITLTGILGLMLYISPLLTLVTLVIVPLMLWVAALIIKKSKTFVMQQQVALGLTDGYIEELISGQKVVQVFSHERQAMLTFNQLNDDLREKATKAQLYSGILMPVIQNLNTINYALTAATGGLLALLRGLDIGGLAAFLQYSRQFGRPVNEISSQFNNLQAGLASAERIFQIMDEAPEPADAPDAVTLTNVKGDVLLDHVTFGYDRGKVILNDISLHALPGQKIALVGATGAGKTTIASLLPRFYDIQGGQICIDHTDIRKLTRDSLRRSLAMVLQDTHLFTGTVLENIRYGRLEATDEEVTAAAKLASADSFIRRLPQGYQTVLESDGNNLSQGQRQLLNIARAAVANPPILILDEATSSIDTRTELQIQTGMDRLMQGRTSFVIAHRLSTVRNADEILVLEGGVIVERGNHKALLQQKGKYYALYAIQFN
jgi:ATP-binding cassette, subfamily B, multidrug efflux pump